MGPTRQASSLHVAAALPGAAGPGSGPCRRTPEHRVGSPPRILLVVDYVGDGAVHIHRGHPLTQPVALHERGGHRPHLQAGGTRRGAASAQACMAGTQPSSWLASHRCRPAARRQHTPPQAPSQPLAAPSRQHSARPFAPHQPEPHALNLWVAPPPRHLRTLKLYGRMKMSAMPGPITRMIHSSKLRGLPCAVVLSTLASTTPVRHLICGRAGVGRVGPGRGQCGTARSQSCRPTGARPTHPHAHPSRTPVGASHPQTRRLEQGKSAAAIAAPQRHPSATSAATPAPPQRATSAPPGPPCPAPRCCSGRGRPPSGSSATHTTPAPACSTPRRQPRWLRGRRASREGRGARGEARRLLLAGETGADRRRPARLRPSPAGHSPALPVPRHQPYTCCPSAHKHPQPAAGSILLGAVRPRTSTPPAHPNQPARRSQPPGLPARAAGLQPPSAQHPPVSSRSSKYW